MKYMTCAEAASMMNMTSRRVQQMCKNGDIIGAVKQGRSWMVPADAFLQIREPVGYHVEKKKPLPIGISDFKVATMDYYYVDKTLMIRDFIDSRAMVSLYTRPRRFGKTLNMDMMRVFFEKTDEDTSCYFKDKKIWACGERYREYQGKYPVIFISFKDVKYKTWKDTVDNLSDVFRREFDRHSYLKKNAQSSDSDREYFNKIITKSATQVELAGALLELSKMLHEHYGIAPIIIIDEYDTPIQQGYMNGFYEEVILFMRNLFSSGLKDNPHLSFGFMTGILRVAKESIFSGLNNLKLYTLLDEAYSQYFGFTKSEVKELLKYYNRSDKYEEVRDWYDGYLFGTTEIYNPWSVINYVEDDCFPKAFWQSTGSNDVIGELISAAAPEIVEGLYQLLMGQSVTTYIDTSVIYPEVRENPYSIYSFLLLAGYLRVSAIYPQHNGNYMCDVGIPNKEISFVYEKEILDKTKQNTVAISIHQAIFLGDVQKLQGLLEKYMLESISSLDGANEGFYHGLMLGLCAVLSDRYMVRSNRESGLGRFDVMLIPRIKSIPGFIFEFKFTRDEKENLDELANIALKQIDEKKYDTELLDRGVVDIIKIGIAFCGKNAVVKK